MSIYKLGDLIEVKDNYRSKWYPKPNEIQTKPSDICFIKISSFSKGYIEDKFWIGKETEDKMPSKGTSILGDILIGVYGTIVLSLNDKYPIARMASGVKALRNKNNNLSINKFIFYKLRGIIPRYAKQGSTLSQINISDIVNISVNIPKISIQQQIIDIIEPKEKLFLKYSNCVRIDEFKNTEKDINLLIDIVEPLEIQIEKIEYALKILKEKMILFYNYYKKDEIHFVDLIKIENRKYKNQTTYLATSAFSELHLDFSKKQILNHKIPSRANLTPVAKSIIFSKLIGENKVFYFDKEPEFVVSTGFYNITSEYGDHIMGFLLSNSFIKQKEIFSSGTTMIGLNNQGMKNIKIKTPNKKSNNEIKIIEKLIDVEIKLLQIQKKLVQLLIK